jgi:hypothetical protein
MNSSAVRRHTCCFSAQERKPPLFYSKSTAQHSLAGDDAFYLHLISAFRHLLIALNPCANSRAQSECKMGAYEMKLGILGVSFTLN